MKCISCESEINPKFKHALDINVCPFCGEHIMEEHLKNCLASLAIAMEDMTKYPDQLNDWMLSNHNFIKTDSPDIGEYMPQEMLKDLKKLDNDKDFQKRKESQKFTVKVQTETGEEEVQAEKIQSEERTNDFFKRAEVIKKIPNNTNPSGPQSANSYQSPAEKTQHLKKVAQQIKRAGATGLGEGGGGMMIPADMLENADPDAVAEFQSMISGGEIASSLDSGGDDDDIHPAVLAMAAKGKGGGGTSNAADLLKLQQMQDRLKNSKAAFESGENRGGKGGGFSRA
jgi:hypothetical protein